MVRGIDGDMRSAENRPQPYEFRMVPPESGFVDHVRNELIRPEDVRPHPSIHFPVMPLKLEPFSVGETFLNLLLCIAAFLAIPTLVYGGIKVYDYFKRR